MDVVFQLKGTFNQNQEILPDNGLNLSKSRTSYPVDKK